MKLLTMNSDIQLSNKSYLVSEIVNSLTKLEAMDLVSYMTSLKLNIPRTLRINVSKALLTSYVETTKEDRETLADEFNYRLRWFSEFSDQQYLNLLDYYNNKDLNQSFKEELMLNILSYCVDSGVSEDHILELYQLGLTKKTQSLENIKGYNQGLDSIFFDEPNQLDGVSLDRVRYIFFKGSTLVELREIGLKYGVDVPKRLKKAELLEAVYDALKERHEYDQTVADALSKKTVIAIQRFAQDNAIKVSSELKKEHVIEYILEHANQTRETYIKPETNPYQFAKEDDIVNDKVKTKTIETVVENPVETKEEKSKEKDEVVEEVGAVETKKEDLQEAVIEEVKSAPESVSSDKVDSSDNLDETKVLEQTDLEDAIQTEGLDIKTMPKTFINALQYQGSIKDYKKEYVGIDAYQEEDVKETKTKAPIELRFIFGIVKVIALIILQTLALILSIVFVLAVIVIVYASVMHFAEPEALIPLNEWINSFEFLGKGLLDHISGVFERIGL
jgi:hypothetical protein